MTKKKTKDLLTQELLFEEYYTHSKSLHDIAKEYNTYPMYVSRLMKKYEIDSRPKSETQRLAIEKNHPTRGRERTEEEKKKISVAGSNAWTDERRDQASDLLKKRWEKSTDKEKEVLMHKARVGLHKTTVYGSRLEKIIWHTLEENSIVFDSQCPILSGEKFKVDIWLTGLNTVIEVDGISHIEPIFGEEKLEKTRIADDRKNKLLLANEFNVIRLIITKKNISKNDEYNLSDLILKLINKVKGKKGLLIKERYDA